LSTYRNKGPVTYQLRWWWHSPRSYTSTATSYDYFNVKITYECDDDSLTQPTDIGFTTYVLGATAIVEQHQPDNTANANCAYTMACEIWNEDSQVWDA